MRFRFPFETLEKERRVRRNEAEREYRLALNKVEEQQSRLNSYKKKLVDAIDQIASVRSGAGQVISTLRSLDEYIRGQKIRIQLQAKTVQGLAEIADQKRLVLVEAAKEVKILEKLREKRYNEFKRELRKREAKVIDEIAIMQTVRRERA